MKFYFLKSMCLLITLFFFFSCETEDSEDVTQDRIFVAYELFYDQSEEKTYARATFTLGNLTGTRLELSNGASISFNEESLPFSSVLGYYELELGNLVDEGTFVYTDLDGNSFTNFINLRAIDLPENTPMVIDRSQSYEIDWVGGEVGSGNSSVVATVVPNNLAQTKIFTQDNEGATSIILTPDILSEIEPQGGSLVLERFDFKEPLQNTEAGGLLTARYRSKSKSITIE